MNTDRPSKVHKLIQIVTQRVKNKNENRVRSGINTRALWDIQIVDNFGWGYTCGKEMLVACCIFATVCFYFIIQYCEHFCYPHG